jgi:hypothetical protein
MRRASVMLAGPFRCAKMPNDLTTSSPDLGAPRPVANRFSIELTVFTHRNHPVAATGYRTVAERPVNPADYPGALPEMLKPGATVFRKTRGPVDLRDIGNWCGWKPGAYWRHPGGKGSSVAGRLDHPVAQVAFENIFVFEGAAATIPAGENDRRYARLISRRRARRITAPTTAAMIEPINPPTAMPNRPNNQPPISEPITPTTMSPTRP